MLISLQIRNFALIENIIIEFGEGLNILSGETGAGKSIIVQAMEFLLGSRGSADLIRQGEEEMEVTGLFSPLKGETSLRRLLSRNGKSRAYWDERPVTVSTLESVGEKLVDIAGQHEHQILLKTESHLDLLDQFADLKDLVQTYQEQRDHYQTLLREEEDLKRREREYREREEFLRFQLKELTEANVKEREEEELQQQREILKNAVRLGEVCLRSEEAIESGEETLIERIGRISKELQKVSSIDPFLKEIEGQVEEVFCRLQEVARQLRHYTEELNFNPGRLQEIEDRLALLSRLKRKYGGVLEGLKKKEEEIRKDLGLLENFEEEIDKKERESSSLKISLEKLARELTEKRRWAEGKLSQEVESELKGLEMTAARFSVHFQRDPSRLGERGVDDVEFLLAPNPGEGARPLAKIASGGELSRIFLALKKVLGMAAGVVVCLFDEVDVGIGGKVAEVVGRKLAQLSKKKQVLCITHLPQIACFADHHFVIQKQTEKGRTFTTVGRLDQKKREEEVARMLAGIRVTKQAVAHAREMLKNATISSL